MPKKDGPRKGKKRKRKEEEKDTCRKFIENVSDMGFTIDISRTAAEYANPGQPGAICQPEFGKTDGRTRARGGTADNTQSDQRHVGTESTHSTSYDD